MPRKAPSQVIEHRISLSDFERRELKQAITAYNRDKWLENINPFTVLTGVGAVGVAAGTCVAAYSFYRWVDLSGEITQAIKNGAASFAGGLATFVTGDPAAESVINTQNATSIEQCDIQYNSMIEDREEALEQLKKMPFPINTASTRKRLQKEIDKYRVLRSVCYNKVRYYEQTGVTGGGY